MYASSSEQDRRRGSTGEAILQQLSGGVPFTSATLPHRKGTSIVAEPVAVPELSSSSGLAIMMRRKSRESRDSLMEVKPNQRQRTPYSSDDEEERDQAKDERMHERLAHKRRLLEKSSQTGDNGFIPIPSQAMQKEKSVKHMIEHEKEKFDIQDRGEGEPEKDIQDQHSNQTREREREMRRRQTQDEHPHEKEAKMHDMTDRRARREIDETTGRITSQQHKKKVASLRQEEDAPQLMAKRTASHSSSKEESLPSLTLESLPKKTIKERQPYHAQQDQDEKDRKSQKEKKSKKENGAEQEIQLQDMKHEQEKKGECKDRTRISDEIHETSLDLQVPPASELSSSFSTESSSPREYMEEEVKVKRKISASTASAKIRAEKRMNETYSVSSSSLSSSSSESSTSGTKSISEEPGASSIKPSDKERHKVSRQETRDQSYIKKKDDVMKSSSPVPSSPPTARDRSSDETKNETRALETTDNQITFISTSLEQEIEEIEQGIGEQHTTQIQSRRNKYFESEDGLHGETLVSPESEGTLFSGSSHVISLAVDEEEEEEGIEEAARESGSSIYVTATEHTPVSSSKSKETTVTTITTDSNGNKRSTTGLSSVSTRQTGTSTTTASYETASSSLFSSPVSLSMGGQRKSFESMADDSFAETPTPEPPQPQVTRMTDTDMNVQKNPFISHCFLSVYLLWS